MSAPDIPVSAQGLLRDFASVGALGWAEVHPAQHLTHLFGEPDPRVQLALALTVRALRSGSICLEVGSLAELGWSDEAPVTVPEEWWPEPGAWLDALRRSPAVTIGSQAPGTRPLRLVDSALYLERHYQDQEAVRAGLLARLADAPVPGPGGPPRGQSAAVELALASPLTVIAGGPGTGKTWTIRHLITRLHQERPGALVALAAPTGKAAARMTEALAGTGLTALTLHTLLRPRDGSLNRFVHDGENPLPHDVVIIDEVSMVSMLLMSRLLAALKPSAHLVLVGDPDQLASVDAGSVLADITRAPAVQPVVARLERNFRFSGSLQRLASAIRDGNADAALTVLREGTHDVRLVPLADGAGALRARVRGAGAAVHEAARHLDPAAALEALDRHRLLCGHRYGPCGVTHWTRQVQDWLGEDVPGYVVEGEAHVGRPVMMTANARDLGLHNGDTGVVLVDDGVASAWFRVAGGLRRYPPSVLDGLATVHAMTVHKAQGSQFGDVSLILPPSGSPLLTRELLYTAVTRAERSVLLLGDADAVREAIARPARRMSGLAHRLG